ncbi:TetR/AcrR family transcriptional regulator [Salinispora arenicola]|uniref:TetR/AcrR family transcriptional regulator n=1 Tax=Salinispora arenicola TaxID=168697 RepID=UPI00169DB4BC|nr:TetR family transcriptional regulator C-terminal domain-containing protein [Salinispora arenicola]NIL56928.1 TetR/AcrR family transcriptional regulator [Salinispora arenicola]NIL63074.1 TetR/AcrR family transcriptional regulator [Salinispora arenicola]
MTTAQHTPKLTARGAATRTRIVVATADLVREHGAAGTSLDDVMAASGTSKSQLYHYFANKDDLLRAAAWQQTDRTMEAQRPELDQLDSLAGLRRWRDKFVTAHDEAGNVGGCPLGSLASELADGDPQTRTVLQKCFTAWASPLLMGLTAMRDQGRLRPDADPDALAEAIMAALQGGLLLSKTYRSSRPLARALDMAIDHVASFSTVPEAAVADRSTGTVAAKV